MHCGDWAVAVYSVLVAGSAAIAAADMADPAIDDMGREWCYLAKSTTVIGVPYMPDAVQVTFDGAIYTTHAELCFFYGDPLRPLMARQKTFLEGWLPVVVSQWDEGPLAYEVEMFGAPLEGADEGNTVQFVRVRIRNTGRQPARASWAAAMRHSGGDCRHGGTPFSPGWRYEMTDDCALRDARLVYTFPRGAGREAVPGVAYSSPFVGGAHCVTPRAEACLTRLQPTLAPGATATLVFKMPRVPVPMDQRELVAAIRNADYETYRAATIAFWKGLFEMSARFEVPEPRVQNAVRAGVVHAMLATRGRGGERFQTDGLPYPGFFMIALPDYQMAYDSLGFPQFFRVNLPQFARRQGDDGLFFDTSLMHGRRLLSSHGQSLQALGQHYLMTRDRDYAAEVYPMIRRAVEWMRLERAKTGNGLLPASWPYDAEMIKGHYTSHNLWGLQSLRTSIRVARELGRADEARAWQAFHNEFEASLLKAIEASAGREGYVPTGLYEFVTGPAARDGFREYQTNQDWENLLLVYPTEVLRPSDPRVAATMARMHRDKYREGIMTYRNGQHLHQYLTTNVTNQHVACGEQEQALIDLYHILLHSGSSHEGYENLVVPWGDRTTSCPPPHGWAAVKIPLLVRNMLVREHGGRGGLDEDQRDLHLFSVVSPAWAEPGRQLAVADAVTEMGRISAAMRFQVEGAEVTFEGKFHHPPRRLVVHVPYFVELSSFTSDAKQSGREAAAVWLTPDATRLVLRWQPRKDGHHGTFERLLLAYRREPPFELRDAAGIATPGREGAVLELEKRDRPVPLSFRLVLEAYRHEYRRRFEEFVKAGGKPTPVAAPPFLTAEERREAFVRQFGEPEVFTQNLACGKPATASRALPEYPPRNAVDGNSHDLLSSWQADTYPSWLEVDLEKPVRIDRIHVFPYWGLGRYYRYTVELSEDGKTWTRVADWGKNTRPATAQGDLHAFEARQARYVRVNMLYHSLNRGVHLVEVRIFEAK